MIFLGPNLRRLRKQAGLTQQQLADTAQLPRATVASMERADANPGLLSVVAVATALRVGLDELVSPPPEHRFFKVTEAEAREYRDDGGRYLSRLLSPLASRGVQIQQVRLEPHCNSGGRPHPMGAQEFFFAYQGTATLHVAGEALSVEAGSLVQFPGHLPHSYHNGSDSQPVLAYSVVILA